MRDTVNFFIINSTKYKLKKQHNIHKKLIEKCRKGNRQAQFDIYKLYYKAMFNTCLRLIADQQEAEDVMQEAFLNAFRKLDTYKGEVNFGSWLKKIVINKALDHIKAQKNEFDEINENYLYIEDEEIEVNDNDIDKTVEKIKQAIMKLADNYRIILTLYLLEGYDHQEIAQILGINPSSSRSQLTRAKNKLKLLMNYE